MLAGRLFEVLGPATADVAALRQTLNTAEPGVFRLEYGQLMRSIDGLLRTAELPVVLDLVTDVQASGLPTRFGELAPRRPAEIVLHDVDGRRGRELDDRQLRRVGADRRADGERAQLCARRRRRAR